jgi:hypothetical protein
MQYENRNLFHALITIVLTGAILSAQAVDNWWPNEWGP